MVEVGTEQIRLALAEQVLCSLVALQGEGGATHLLGGSRGIVHHPLEVLKDLLGVLLCPLGAFLVELGTAETNDVIALLNGLFDGFVGFDGGISPDVLYLLSGFLDLVTQLFRVVPRRF